MSSLRNLGRLVAAVYAWILAIFVGAVLLDIVYSGLLEGVGGCLNLPAVYSEVADFLLIPGSLAVLSGLAAIVTSWHVRLARNLFLASLVLLVGFEFLLPVFLFPALRTSAGPSFLGLGPWIRLVPTALASILALAGSCKLSHASGSAASTLR
jgi:hypothetical protein